MVEQTKRRSRWPARRTLAALGIPSRSYYRWLREEAWAKQRTAAVRPVQCYEALEEEKQAVRSYACRHTELRHRELAWRMIDEEVAYLSPSTVYRILRESNLVCPWRRRSKRRREELEKAQRPNERWGTDLMYVRFGAGQYYLVTFLDEYSRYLVHWELLTDMRGASVSLAAEGALRKERHSWEGKEFRPPEIRSDNGSCYLSREFKQVLEEQGLTHQLIKPHCPEENGLVERSNRTLREALEETQFASRQEAEKELARIITWYNDRRLHSALGYLRPADYYRGKPEELHAARRTKLAQGVTAGEKPTSSYANQPCPWKTITAPLKPPAFCATADETFQKRKQWSSVEKLRIVLAGLQADTKISELCRREGISATQFYQWKDRLLGSAAKVFEDKSSGPSAARTDHGAVARMKDVIAEITAENVELKKTLSD